jgi:hypothetical protein
MVSTQTWFFLESSVADPWHFGTDLDANPDPRIRTSDQQIRMLIRDVQKPKDPMDPDSGTLVHLHNSKKKKSHREVTKE